jgi:hypothetical protein
MSFRVAHNLLEATVSLYPSDANGVPVLGGAVWSEAPAENW